MGSSAQSQFVNFLVVNRKHNLGKFSHCTTIIIIFLTITSKILGGENLTLGGKSQFPPLSMKPCKYCRCMRLEPLS